MRFVLRGKIAKLSVAMIDGCQFYVHANISINTICYEFVYLICLNLLDYSKAARRQKRVSANRKNNIGACRCMSEVEFRQMRVTNGFLHVGRSGSFLHIDK